MSGTPRWILGVDIGGTNVVVAAMPIEGGDPTALRKERTHPDRGADDVVRRVAEMLEGAISDVLTEHGGRREDFAGVGIGSPGPLDRERGVVLEAPNLGWEKFPLRDRVSDAVRLPAVLDNDANCATYGEWWMGAGQGMDPLIGITLGTGIGGGIILNGEIHHGVSDAAGEVGHMAIDFTGRRCNCGNYGCLEAYASGTAIAARAVEGLEAGVESLLTEMVSGDLTELTAATVYEAAIRGDRYADDVLVETAKVLGAGIANLINLLNPQGVVLTGGVTRAGEHLFGALRAEVRRRAFRSATEACTIGPGALPDTAGVIGAAGIFKKTRLGSV